MTERKRPGSDQLMIKVTIPAEQHSYSRDIQVRVPPEQLAEFGRGLAESLVDEMLKQGYVLVPRAEYETLLARLEDLEDAARVREGEARSKEEREEFQRREEMLKRFIDRFLFPVHVSRDPLSDGWLATPDDLERLDARNEEARFAGLRRCTACQELRGEWLALDGEGNGDRRARVVFVHCSCDNRTCCARCGRPLAPARLSSFRFKETRAGGGVVFTHAYQCSGHRCPDGRRA